MSGRSLLKRALLRIGYEWDEIDREYLREPARRGHVAAILLTAALALVLPKYFGSVEAFRRMPLVQAAFRPLPFPNLHPHLYWSAFKLVHYGLLPYLCMRFVLKRGPREHGLRFVWEPKVWLLYASMLGFVLPLTFLASGTSSFLRTYPKYAGAGNSLAEFLCWELAYAFQFFMLEFFFRGFLTFALARNLGANAIFVMVVPYAMIHLSKPFAECLGSIVTGIVLGTVALRTRSIYGGVAVHCVVAISMDVFALAAKGLLWPLFVR